MFRLSDLSERVELALSDSRNLRELTQIKVNTLSQQLQNEYSQFIQKWNIVPDLKIILPLTHEEVYQSFVSTMSKIAGENALYWMFNLELISLETAQEYCSEYPRIVASEKWRVLGDFNDIISLAKLTGKEYNSNNQFILSGFTPEESYWVRELELIKICSNEKWVGMDLNGRKSRCPAKMQSGSRNSSLLIVEEERFSPNSREIVEKRFSPNSREIVEERFSPNSGEIVEEKIYKSNFEPSPNVGICPLQQRFEKVRVVDILSANQSPKTINVEEILETSESNHRSIPRSPSSSQRRRFYLTRQR